MRGELRTRPAGPHDASEPSGRVAGREGWRPAGPMKGGGEANQPATRVWGVGDRRAKTRKETRQVERFW